MRGLILIACLILLEACGTSRATLIPQKGFKLSRSSVVCISKHYLAADLEAVLLDMGLQVVPYEFAIEKAVNKVSTGGDTTGEVRSSESYQVTEIPAAILIKIDGYDSMQFRFIDMQTHRLLAVYKYRVDPNYESVWTKSPLERFRKAILPYIVP